jgi:hypothetical protein
MPAAISIPFPERRRSMSAPTTSSIVFLSLFGAILLGMYLRSVLPEHHLSAEAKESVRIGMGSVATMAALVLGLLVASTKGTYDAEKAEVTQMAAKIIYLDRLLASYGPETKEARDVLRSSVESAMTRIWSSTDSQHGPVDPSTSWTESLPNAIQKLAPKNEMQTSFRSQAASLIADLGQMRWLLFEQEETSISVPLLVIVISWLAIIFLSVGLFAPPNGTVIVALLLSALSVSAAILLILELDMPFDGLIQISNEPMRNALSHLGH